ncbi:hypothetical protein [Alkalihalobacillus trypoxylicola]|uniref:Copper amine oxidase n=1 Tax=Alkalihalobacillus trypoxylicola TaxID=519424 RepID=A0A162D623_9BACI|nr:hypothetical protein [Alkalihalobacillus trypoxylicola]KYG28249.1 hypothetical protein AZF04_10145 [Alkalihalobacillus trypoxylicola]
MKFRKTILTLIAFLLLTPTFAFAENSNNPTETPAVELRSALSHLLSEHFVLAFKSMTMHYDQAPGADEAQMALEENAADMKPAIASLYGDEGAEEFDRIFADHNKYTADYAVAVREEDQEAQEEATEMLDMFIEDFSSFLGEATEGNLPKEAAMEVLEIHEQQVEDAFNAYVDGDYETAYMTFREGYMHMFDVSAALTEAIVAQFPDDFEGSLSNTDAADLRMDLSSLTAEHFLLATTGMIKEFSESPDLDFVSWAEDENTADLKAAISSIYGEEGGNQFEMIWQGNHIVAQSEYVTAVKNEDEEAKQEAIDKLNTFAIEFGEFVGEATENNLPAETVTELVNKHEEQVMMTFDLYVAEDFDASYDQFREGYAFMFDIGKGLSTAIATQHSEMFEEDNMPGMPKTGMGGMSQSSSLFPTALYLLAGMLIITGGVVGLKKFKSERA